MNKKNIGPFATAMMCASALAACGQSEPVDENGTPYETANISYSNFLRHVEQGHVESIRIAQRYNGETVYWDPYHLKPDFDEGSDNTLEEAAEQAANEAERTVESQEIEGLRRAYYVIGVPGSENVYARVQGHNVDVMVDRSRLSSGTGDDYSIWDTLLPFLIMGGILGAAITAPLWISAIRSRKQAKKAKGKHDISITFKDVAGVDEAIEEIEDIVDYLKDPKKFRDTGLKVPKGLLMTGPPGNGKTLLAKAIAGETGANFISISGSEFGGSKWMGDGTKLVKTTFKQARDKAPCIVFIDEIDSVGRKRSEGGDSGGGGVIDRENTLNQLLTELDGFDSHKHDIVLIAATNRPDMLDPALTRPGRIDRQVQINKPDMKSRERILNIYLKKHQCEPDVNAKELAKVTYNFSGAQLAGLINEAGLLAVRKNRKVISRNDIEEAKDKILLGKEFKTRQFSEEERNITAYHEAGHALVGHYLPHSHPIYKATIVPRGRTLGVVHRAPESDVSSQSLATLKADLAVAMAGRMAELLIFGEENVTTGAAGDFQQAYNMARAMVFQNGMSSGLKPYFIENSTHGLSTATLNALDGEVDKLLDEATETARSLLSDNWDEFVALAEALLKVETLDAKGISDILGPNRARESMAPNKTAPSARKTGGAPGTSPA